MKNPAAVAQGGGGPIDSASLYDTVHEKAVVGSLSRWLLFMVVAKARLYRDCEEELNTSSTQHD